MLFAYTAPMSFISWPEVIIQQTASKNSVSPELLRCLWNCAEKKALFTGGNTGQRRSIENLGIAGTTVRSPLRSHRSQPAQYSRQCSVELRPQKLIRKIAPLPHILHSKYADMYRKPERAIDQIPLSILSHVCAPTARA